MRTDTAPPARTGAATPRVVQPGNGRHHHFLNHLATVAVAGDQSPARMSVVVFDAPRGFGPPLHVHREEDEIMFVIDGSLRLCAGDVDTVAGAGSVVLLPHGVPHTFQVTSDGARFLTVSGGGSQEPSFDRLVTTLGTPLATPELPEPVAIDPAAVAAACAANGIEVLGPPPAPLP